MSKGLTDGIAVDVLKVLRLPLGASRHLVFPPLPLLVLHNNMHTISILLTRSHENRTKRTSILLFSRLAVSKSPSRIPFATYRHNRLLSHSSISSTDATVTSSFAPCTSVNGAPVRASLLEMCHSPSYVRFALFDPGGDSTALNWCDFPLK